MTRKDYIAIAEILASTHGTTYHAGYGMLQDIAEKIARLMERDNPRFDRVKFLEACGL